MRNLVRGAFYSSAGTLSTLLFGAVLIKILAVYNGPQGVGLFSILRQLQQTLVVLALLGGQTAIVQGLASREGVARAVFLTTTAWISIFATLVSVVILLSCAPLLAEWLFAQQVNGVVLIYGSVSTLICGGAFTYLCSVINGNRAVGAQSLLQLFGAVLGAVLAYPMAILYQRGVLIAYIWLLSAPFLLGAVLAGIFCYRRGYLAPLRTMCRTLTLAMREAKYFLSFAMVTLITTLLQTGVLLIVRALIVQDSGMAAVGKFDAAWTLSMMYVMLILNSLAVFYLPELSGAKDAQTRKQLIDGVLRLALVALIPLVTAVLEFKQLYIKIFYADAFLPATKLIQWMVLGDFFKVFGWVFAVSMLAYARMKPFFSSELLWQSGFLLGCYLILTQHAPPEYIGMLFLGLYFLYFVFCFVYIRTCWNYKLSSKYAWALGLAFVYLLVIALLTWHDDSIHWWRGITTCLGSLALSWIFWRYTAADE